MQIQEEYILRHNLNVNVIKYPNTINVLLRNENYQWLILNGVWENDPGHPGYYNFRYIKPIHDGCFEKNFEELAFWGKVYWDQYEQFITVWIEELKFCKGLGFKAVVDEYEIQLNFWEIFLYTHDYWISKTFATNSEFFNLVYKSTDTSLNLIDRFRLFRTAFSFLDNYLGDISPKYIFNYSKNYSFWLAKLVNL